MSVLKPCYIAPKVCNDFITLKNLFCNQPTSTLVVSTGLPCVLQLLIFLPKMFYVLRLSIVARVWEALTWKKS